MQGATLGGIVAWIVIASHLNVTRKLRSLLQPWVSQHVVTGTPWYFSGGVLQKYQHRFLDALFSGLSCVVSVPFYTGFLPLLFWSGHSRLARQMTLLMAFCDYVGNCIKSVESYNKAISVGGIMVKSFLPIRPPQVQETATIRIINISSGIADSAIHSTCMSYGALEGLVRTEYAVDASFCVKDNSDTQSILKKLNYSIMDGCKWIACLHGEEAASGVTTNNDDSRYKLGL